MGNDTPAATPQTSTDPQAAPQHASADAIAAGTAAQPPQQPKPQPPNGAGETPDWLPERLAQAKRTATTELLNTLGVKSKDELATRLTKLSELEKESMTDAEKRQAEIDALKPKAEAADRFEKLFGSLVEQQFSVLSEQQQQAIDAVASGNAEQRWQLMQVVRAAVPETPAAPAQPPKPPPATTVPGGAPPPPANPAQPQTPWEIWQSKQQDDPVGAAIFYNTNSVAIERSAPQT